MGSPSVTKEICWGQQGCPWKSSRNSHWLRMSASMFYLMTFVIFTLPMVTHSMMFCFMMAVSRRNRAKCHWEMVLGWLRDRRWRQPEQLWIYTVPLGYTWDPNLPSQLQILHYFHRERIESGSSGNLRLTVGVSEAGEGWERQGARDQRR